MSPRERTFQLISERMCKKKIPYPNRDEAEKALKDFQSRPNCHSKKVYFCPFCGRFHLSSKDETPSRTKKIDRVIIKLKREGRI